MQCKLHDEVEGSSRIGAGAQKTDHVWMVHLYKRQHVMYETAAKIQAEACLSHHHTSMMAATFFRRVYSVIKKYVKKNVRNIYKIIEKNITSCYLRRVYSVIKKYVKKKYKIIDKIMTATSFRRVYCTVVSLSNKKKYVKNERKNVEKIMTVTSFKRVYSVIRS